MHVTAFSAARIFMPKLPRRIGVGWCCRSDNGYSYDSDALGSVSVRNRSDHHMRRDLSPDLQGFASVCGR